MKTILLNSLFMILCVSCNIQDRVIFVKKPMPELRIIEEADTPIVSGTTASYKNAPFTVANMRGHQKIAVQYASFGCFSMKAFHIAIEHDELKFQAGLEYQPEQAKSYKISKDTREEIDQVFRYYFAKKTQHIGSTNNETLQIIWLEYEKPVYQRKWVSHAGAELFNYIENLIIE